MAAWEEIGMPEKYLRLLFRIFVFAVFVSASACNRDRETGDLHESTEPVSGGTLVLGIANDVDRWNPYLSSGDTSYAILRRMYLPLADPPPISAMPDQESTLRNRLAASWERAADGLSITVKLRELNWSDGKAITAGDVRFTWQSAIADEIPWNNKETKRWITDVEILDPRTVRFHFARRYPYQLIDMLYGLILPEHVFSDIPLSDWAGHDWSQERIGSGPFLLAEHRKGERIRMVRNPNYGEPQRPRIDELVLLIAPDPTARVLLLRAGEIDAADGLTPRDAQTLNDLPGITVHPRLEPKYDYLAWNQRRPPLDDVRVRRALTQLIDRQALVDELHYGKGVVATGPVPTYHWATASDLPDPGYDPPAAADNLRSAGLVSGPDGTWLYDGNPFAPELITSDSSAIRRDVLVRIQQKLNTAGIPATIRTLETSALRKTVGSGDFDAYLSGWVFFDNPDLAGIFGADGQQNFTGYRSEAFEALRPAIANAETPAALFEVVAEMQRLIVSDQAYTFLYEPQRILAIGPRLHGLRFPDPLDPWGTLDEAWVQP
jgi:peptide/nickel transport system substrate-binding protein